MPAGQTQSAPFLLTLPLTNPQRAPTLAEHRLRLPEGASMAATKTVDGAHCSRCW